MKRKNFIVLIALAIVILAGTMLVAFFAKSDNRITESAAEDNGYQIAVDKKLMTPVDVRFKDSTAEIKNAYFDGLRIYLDIYTPDGTELDVAKVALFDTQNQKIVADHVFTYRDNITVLIWDNYSGGSNVTLQLVTTDGIIMDSPLLKLENIQASILDVEKYFEEMLLHTITIGTTSTLFNIEIYTLLEIDKFQIEVDDEVRTSVNVSNHTGSQNYTILFPTVVDVENTFIIHSLDISGNIVMSIPVSLEIQE